MSNVTATPVSSFTTKFELNHNPIRSVQVANVSTLKCKKQKTKKTTRLFLHSTNFYATFVVVWTKSRMGGLVVHYQNTFLF